MAMKKLLLKTTTLLILICGLLSSAHAKVWRVNNTPGVSADFPNTDAAFSSTSVLSGDTVYVEGSATSYGVSYLRKKLVIIGPGYFLDAAGNPGLQFNIQAAQVQILFDDSLASSSTMLGLSGKIYLHPAADNITISRCNLQIVDGNPRPGRSIDNMTITKSVIDFYSNSNFNNLYFANNIVVKYANFANAFNSLMRNNVFTVQLTSQGSYISNNIFVNASLKLTNCTVKYNIATNNILPAGDNNKNNILVTALFSESISPDAKYILKAGSPAIAAGEPINGITPDAGAFGTADPYRLSGIPPIPSIYSLTVPQTVPGTATKMSITFSTRSNN